MVTRREVLPKTSLRQTAAAAEGYDSLRRRLVARDERALAELIDTATPWLLGVAEGMLMDRDDAEEVVADVLMTAWNRSDLLDDRPGGLMPWLLRITRNRAIDRLRSRSRFRRRATEAHTMGALPPEVTAAREPDEAGVAGWHVHHTVHEALSALPEDQQAAIQLAYFQGLTHSEIAERLGVPIGTVKSRLRRAFVRLRSSLGTLKDWVL